MAYFNWNDTKNVLSKLTLRRGINAAKVVASYQLSKLLKKPVQWGYPFPFLLNQLHRAIFAVLNAPVDCVLLHGQQAC